MNREEKNNAIEELISKMKTPFDNSKESSWGAIQKKVDSNETPVYSLMNYSKKKFPISLAASIVILLSLALFLYSTRTNTIYSELEQTIQYSDNFEAFLFKKTEFSYIEKNDKRIVKLDGGGIFDVQKGNPFVIETKAGNIEVMGTVFSVNAHGKYLLVKCSEGSVKVSNKRFSQIVESGESLIISKDYISTSKIKSFELSDRKKGILYFSETPLEEVIVQLENEFDISISSQLNLNSLMYTGNFSNSNLDEALDLVTVPMGIKYEINNSKVELYK